MPIYHKRPHAESYGQGVGILLLDARAPLIPGDVGNATTYDYPVTFKTVPGLTTDCCLGGEPGFEEAVIEAAIELERSGVRGLSSDCGFMIQFQDAVADAVSIPVALSSLLQLPLIARSVAPHRPIGILTADSVSLTAEMLVEYGLKVENPVVIRGAQDEPEFNAAIMQAGAQGSPSLALDSDRIERECVDVAMKMVADHPDMGAILIECSVMPPYAKAVQAATGLPCYDFIDVIDYMEAGTSPKSYAGHY